MPVHGFRLFVATVYPERRQTQVDFGECGARHYRDVAAEVLEQMMDKVLVTERRQDTPIDDGDGATDDDPPQDPLYGRKGLSLRRVQVEGHLIYGEMLVGTFGGHEEALDAPPEESPELVEVQESEDTDTAQPPTAGLDLRRRAPARRFRFVLCMPESGTRGVLAVEDISGSCPRTLLREWLNKRGKDAADAALAAVPQPEGTPKAKGKKEPTWWRVDINPALDEEHFERMIAQGQLDRVELKRTAIASDGSRPRTDLHVIAPILDATNRRAAFLDLAKTWTQVARERRRPPERRARRSKDEREREEEEARAARMQTDREGAEALAALVDPAIQQIEFDDGWIVVEDAGEKTKRVSPSRISELFTYEINRKRQPTPLEFYQAARGKALALAAPLQLALEWPATPAILKE